MKFHAIIPLVFLSLVSSSWAADSADLLLMLEDGGASEAFEDECLARIAQIKLNAETAKQKLGLTDRGDLYVDPAGTGVVPAGHWGGLAGAGGGVWIPPQARIVEKETAPRKGKRKAEVKAACDQDLTQVQNGPNGLILVQQNLNKGLLGKYKCSVKSLELVIQ
jgi:hypothetical protein